jgi:hypothetical protein
MNEAAFVRRLYWWSFALRCLAGLGGWLLTQYAELSLMDDASYYDYLAVEMAQDWQAGESSRWLESATGGVHHAWLIGDAHHAWLMVVMLAVIYFLAGGAHILPVAIIGYCLITAWAPVLTYRLGLQAGAPVKGARVGAWLVALSPAFAFWSGALYKEGLILIVLNLALYHVLRLQERWRPRSLLVLCLCLMAFFGLRFYLAIILGLVLPLGLLFGRARSQEVGAGPAALLRQVLLVLCLAGVLYAVGFIDLVMQQIPSDLTEGLARVQNSRDDLASVSSGYLRDRSVSSFEEGMLFLPLGLFYFLTVPWPWQLESYRQMLAIPETAVWVLLYGLVFVGVREGLRRRPQATFVLVFTSLAIAGFYALWVGNAGSAFRLRLQVWGIWAPFVGWGWVTLRPPMAPRRRRSGPAA